MYQVQQADGHTFHGKRWFHRTMACSSAISAFGIGLPILMTPLAKLFNPEGESPFYNEFFFFGLLAFGFALGIATGVQYYDSKRFWLLISLTILAIVCSIGYAFVALQFEPKGMGRGIGSLLLVGYTTGFSIFAGANLILAAIISMIAELMTRNAG